MRGRTWAALGAALALAQAWRWYTEPFDVAVEEVAPVLEPNPDPDFPWHQFEFSLNIPEHWIAEARGRFERKLPPKQVSSRKYDSTALTEQVNTTYVAAKAPPPNNWWKEHVAFSSLPGIGRPLELDENGALVLNGFWEATPEEKRFRAARQDWWEQIAKLRGAISSIGMSNALLTQIERGEYPFSVVYDRLKERQSALTKAKKAARELEPLMDAAPVHPSLQ